jgi:hypothetical protein
MHAKILPVSEDAYLGLFGKITFVTEVKRY